MNSHPTVSIITPVYNGSAYIENLILSILEQDYPRIEHIVIDDGSTDGGATAAVLKKYTHLRWWSRENLGQYASMNEGLQAASGDIICFISADDLLANQAVVRVVDWFMGHPDYKAVYGLTSYLSEADGASKVNRLVRYAPLKFYPYLPHSAQFQHCSFFIDKNAVLAQQLVFNPALKYSGDYDWIIRLLKAGIRIGFLDEVLSTVRLHGGQASVINREAMAREKLQVARSYHLWGLELQFLIKMIRARLLSMV